jgi:hypothetical protein
MYFISFEFFDLSYLPISLSVIFTDCSVLTDFLVYSVLYLVLLVSLVFRRTTEIMNTLVYIVANVEYRL